MFSVRENGVVPVTMELVGSQVDGHHLLGRGLHVPGVLVSVQHATDLEPRLGFGGRDETDDGRMTEQGLTSPVLRNE